MEKQELLKKLNEVSKWMKSRDEAIRTKRSRIRHVDKPLSKYGAKVYWYGVLAIFIFLLFTPLTFIWKLMFALTISGVVTMLLRHSVKRANAEAKIVVDKKNDEIERLNDKMNALLKKLEENYVEMFSEWYPQDYKNLHACNSFIKIITNHRADSLKEAINIFESDETNRELIRNTERQVKVSREANDRISNLNEQMERQRSDMLGAIYDADRFGEDRHEEIMYELENK